MVGRSRGGFLPPRGRASSISANPPVASSVPPPPPESLVVGIEGFQARVRVREPVVPARRVGLTRPRRPRPSSDESGPSNWASSSASSREGTANRNSNPSSNYVGLTLQGLGIGFGTSIGNSSTSNGTPFFNSNSNGTPFFNNNSNGTPFDGTPFFTTDSRSTGHVDDVSLLFDNADEFAPSRRQAEARPRRAIDLNVMASKATREYYTTETKRQIYATILQRNGSTGRMKRGVLASVSKDHEVPRRVVSRLWEMGRIGNSINAVKCNRMKRCGRKKIPFDAVAMKAIPPNERTTLEALAHAMNVKKTTLQRRLKEKEFRRCTNEVKPSLMPENIKQRLEYCLRNLEPASLAVEPTFKAGFNVVHIDEKWFFRTKKNQKVYLTPGEEPPHRETKNKGHIQKIMFLSAMTRPRYDRDGNCTFDGKIGVWPYVEWVQAQKRSKNRLRGAFELKPMEKVGKSDSREYLVKYVLPAIKNKWPLSDRWNTIYIQQDNAKTHVTCDDPVVVAEAAKGFCENYEKLIRDFWWGDEENQRKVHWSAWDNLIKPKAKGGLGFRDISLFNQALLARMAWRLIQKPNSLCARVLKARYYPHGNILDTVFALDPSPAWKGVEHGLELLKKGIISRIGDGRNTQIMRDQWIPREAGLKITALKKNSRKRWVNQLISPATNNWNTDLLCELFYEHDMQAITEIEIPSTGQGGRIAWHFERNGVFTVKSAYRLALDLKHRNRDISSCSMAPNGDRSI
ncbi:hypothetical protein ACQ4PT_050030 [Festuca glaucescens]